MQSMFHFKQFSVRQDRCAMKVGTDGVLLGALALGIENREQRIENNVQSSMFNVQSSMFNVLDIGTGTGVVALMLAQRYPEARIVGVEIDPEAAAQAAENFAASPWGDRLTAVCADARELGVRSEELGVRSDKSQFSIPLPIEGESEGVCQFSILVCNPPYYAHSPASSSQARDAARRADTLTFEELADTASRLLCDDGIFEVIIPFSAADDFIHTCWLHDLHLMRRIDIRTKPDKPFKRSVLAFTNANHNSSLLAPHSSLLTLFNADGTPTDEYRAITADFLY